MSVKLPTLLCYALRQKVPSSQSSQACGLGYGHPVLIDADFGQRNHAHGVPLDSHLLKGSHWSQDNPTMAGLRDVGVSYHGAPPTGDTGYGIMQDYQSRDPRVSFMSAFPVGAWSFAPDMAGGGPLARSL